VTRGTALDGPLHGYRVLGDRGPAAAWKAVDIVAWAASGMMSMMAGPGRPPLQLSVPQACFHAGAEAAVASLLGVDAEQPVVTAHADRVARPDEMDRYVGDLLAHLLADEVVRALQEAGVSAYAVQDCAQVRDDENLRAFGFFPTLEQSECGPMPYDGLAYRLGRTPGEQRAAPDLGEHTDAVLSGLLGMGASEITRLREAGVLR
jgi:crotonobetainyl-CoA:carnitine CoA-transferase CaiB-like acyl-CoA transferase